MLSYQSADMVGFLKGAMGWNAVPTEVGQRIQADVLDRYRSGRVKAVIGEVVPFEDLPRAVNALAERRTVGRVIVRP
jgi:NADPH:quinone reductase-like Zn-dependent oxidoreductase